jgi:hypothetical protein
MLSTGAGKMIRVALADARAELAALDVRRSELEVLISQGEAALGDAYPSMGKTTMTLHEALAQILRENGNSPMTARSLANAVNDAADFGPAV